MSKLRYANLRVPALKSRRRSVSWIRLFRATLGMSVLAGALAGCRPTPLRTPTDASLSVNAGTVTLRHLDPPEATILRRGLKLSITVTAEYDLKVAEAGAIGVAVQDQYGRSLVVGSNQRIPVKRGRGEATISTEVLIKDMSTRKVVVYVALKADGYAGTSAVGRAEYNVTP